MNALTTNPPKINNVFLDPIKLEGRRNNSSIKESMMKLEGTTRSSNSNYKISHGSMIHK
jgi:hypothetical protein